MFRKAEADDLNAVAAIYERIHEYEQRGALCIGWLPGIYPVRATAQAALSRADLYVCENAGHVSAAAIINRQQVDVYADGAWKYPAAASEVMVLHTLVVDPIKQAKGIGTAFAAFYEACAREAGCTVLRIDTNEKNTAARRFYAGLGYREAGIVTCVFNGIPDVRLVLLEKRVGL